MTDDRYKVALEALLNEPVEAAKEAPDDPFGKDLRMAYHDLASFAIEQAEIFGLAQVDLGLADLDQCEPF